MLLDTRLAYDLEPPGSPWHPLAATMLGVAHLLSGSAEEAAKLFERGALLGVEQARPAASLALAQLALLAADDQDWAAAQRNAAQAEQVMAAGNLRDDMASVLTHLAAAKVDVRRDRSQQARQRLGTAVRVYLGVPPTAFPWMAAQAAVVLGEVSLRAGRHKARPGRALEDARRHLARLLTEGVLREPAGRAVGRRGQGRRSQQRAERDGVERGRGARPADRAHPPVPGRDRRRAARLAQHGEESRRRGLPQAAGLHPDGGGGPGPRLGLLSASGRLIRFG